MQKCLPCAFLLLILTPVLCALDWGVLPEAVEPETKQQFLLQKLKTGAPVKYCLDEDGDPAYTLPAVAQDIEAALRAWPAAVLKQIKASGRAADFADITPYFARGFKFERLQKCTCGIDGRFDGSPKPCDEDIAFNFQAEGFVGLYSGRFHAKVGESAPFIYAEAGPDFRRTLTHELGHALGLADQYPGVDNADYRYGTSDKQPALMDSAAAIQCDDIEGIINIFDCFVPDKPFLRGGDKGWQSICPGRGIVYKNCLAVNRAPYISQEGGLGAVSFYNKNGRLQDTQNFTLSLPRAYESGLKSFKPFPVKEGDIVKRDALSRPLETSYKNAISAIPVSKGIFEYEKNGFKAYFLLPPSPLGNGESAAFTMSFNGKSLRVETSASAPKRSFILSEGSSKCEALQTEGRLKENLDITHYPAQDYAVLRDLVAGTEIRLYSALPGAPFGSRILCKAYKNRSFCMSALVDMRGKITLLGALKGVDTTAYIEGAPLQFKDFYAPSSLVDIMVNTLFGIKQLKADFKMMEDARTLLGALRQNLLLPLLDETKKQVLKEGLKQGSQNPLPAPRPYKEKHI